MQNSYTCQQFVLYCGLGIAPQAGSTKNSWPRVLLNVFGLPFGTIRKGWKVSRMPPTGSLEP